MTAMLSWFNFLRFCLFCGLYKPPIDILCNSCWKKYVGLSVERYSRNSLQYDFSVKRVWVWNKINEPYIQKIIYNLKGGHSDTVFEKLSILLLQKINFQYYQGREIIFIPAPALRSKKNHALCLAKSLSKLTGCKYYDLLVVSTKNTKQKMLSKIERSKKVFNIVNINQDLNRYQVIFIDDVITTGATARAAYRALNQPKNFEVWVLAEKLNFAKEHQVSLRKA